MAKRRLPVLSSSSGEEPEELRPPWHWVGFGSVLVFAVWLPLAALLQKLSPMWLSALVGGATDEVEVVARVHAMRGSKLAWYYVLVIGPQAAALALAAFAGGFVVARYGKPVAGMREAALAGMSTGIIACALAVVSAGLSWAFLVVIALATAFSALGGRVGRR